jgi:hypothetical protein
VNEKSECMEKLVVMEKWIILCNLEGSMMIREIEVGKGYLKQKRESDDGRGQSG